MKYQFRPTKYFIGFTAEAIKAGNPIDRAIIKAAITSDDPQFYPYIDSISNNFLEPNKIFPDDVYRFLVVIHYDNNTDVYVNDFNVSVRMRVKREIKEGDDLMYSDIVDIQDVHFPDIDFFESDRIIYCFKVGWRFGLFFDLTSRFSTSKIEPSIVEKLDLEWMESTIGSLRRHLAFYHVYKPLEASITFENLVGYGWFPFVEFISLEYKELAEVIMNGSDVESREVAIVNSFNEQRIRQIIDKWWSNAIFDRKKTLLIAGIKAYCQNDEGGFINCIKNLCTEIEGILRIVYHLNTGKGQRVKSIELVDHIIKEGRKNGMAENSLLLPKFFLQYLKLILFANFNIETGDIKLSRNSSSHGVVDAREYTKKRALQLILTLDQIFYFM